MGSLRPKYTELNDDITAIEKSLELNVTRTFDPSRGIGLFEIKRNIARLHGELLILSGKGLYNYHCNLYKSKEELKKYTLTNYFAGTLIQVVFPIPEEFQFPDDIGESLW